MAGNPHRLQRRSFIPHYPRTAAGRIWELMILPALIVLGLYLVVRYSGLLPHSVAGVSLGMLAMNAALTLMRLGIAYILALVIAVPLAIAATHSPLAQRILLPLFDILQSVPILAFFPIIVAIFIHAGVTNGAAIFILFLAMLWNIVFALIGGVGLIPKDILYAAEVYGVRGFAYFRRILLPAVVPQMIVGSILALAQGWNIIIVVEVIRTYLPPGSPIGNLPGLGSMLVSSAAEGQSSVFIVAFAAVVLIIACINFFVWQRLLKYAQRFRFE